MAESSEHLGERKVSGFFAALRTIASIFLLDTCRYLFVDEAEEVDADPALPELALLVDGVADAVALPLDSDAPEEALLLAPELPDAAAAASPAAVLVPPPSADALAAAPLFAEP